MVIMICVYDKIFIYKKKNKIVLVFFVFVSLHEDGEIDKNTYVMDFDIW